MTASTVRNFAATAKFRARTDALAGTTQVRYKAHELDRPGLPCIGTLCAA